MHSVTLIPGDGIGPRNHRCGKKTVIDAAGVDIHWDEQQVGQNALENAKSLAGASLKASRPISCLKGPVTTHVGKGLKASM